MNSDSNNNVIALIFSKDRALQLYATIESWYLHCADPANASLCVLYKASDQANDDQYEQLKRQFENVNFIRETDFKSQMMGLLDSCRHIIFIVDDNMFVSRFNIAQIENAMDHNPEAIGFSLRLGTNTTFSYNHSCQMPLPQFSDLGGNILAYNWPGQMHEFGYPLELSSSLYRSKDLIPLLVHLGFGNPNMFEGLMALNTGPYVQPRSMLLCYKTSVAFCNPINLVQTVCDNKIGSVIEYSAESLAQRFRAGERIDVSQYDGFVSCGCHQDVELKFRSEDKAEQNENPLVSVYMVTYNTEKYIKLAIESVLKQTYNNYELIIVDDGSIDDTANIVSQYNDSRIRYIFKPHKNFASGVNRAIAEARGEFFLGVDSDDFIEEDYISQMVAFAKDHPHVDYFYPARFTLVDENSRLMGSQWDYLDFSDNTVLPNFLFVNAFSPIPNPASLKRMSMFERLGVYEERDPSSDFVFLCKNALNIKFKKADIEAKYFYRRLQSSNSHKFKARNENTAAALNQMVENCPAEMVYPQLSEVGDPILKKQQYLRYVSGVFYNHADKYKELYGEPFAGLADFYKDRLFNCIGRVNRTARSTVAENDGRNCFEMFQQALQLIQAERPSQALACLDQISKAGKVFSDFNYAKAVAMVMLGNIEQAKRACLEELNIGPEHQAAQRLLEHISA